MRGEGNGKYFWLITFLRPHSSRDPYSPYQDNYAPGSRDTYGGAGSGLFDRTHQSDAVKLPLDADIDISRISNSEAATNKALFSLLVLSLSVVHCSLHLLQWIPMEVRIVNWVCRLFIILPPFDKNYRLLFPALLLLFDDVSGW